MRTTKDIGDIVLYQDPETGRYAYCIVEQAPYGGRSPKIAIQEAEQDSSLIWLIKRTARMRIIDPRECRGTIRRIRRQAGRLIRSHKAFSVGGKEASVITPLDIAETAEDGIIRYLIRFRADGKLGIAREDELKEMKAHELTREMGR